MLEYSFIIVLTRKCDPCGCSYCNILKQDFNKFRESIYEDKKYFEYIVLKILSYLKENNVNTVRFFGGEVFLEKNILVDFIKIFRKNDFKGEIYVNTNLHLFNEKDIFWIKNSNVKIITSLNGFEDLHTKTRGISKEKYVQLLKNIKYLIKNNINLQINTVLFPYEETFIEKIKFILNLKANLINLLPLMYSPLLKEDILNDFKQKLENLIKWINENNLQKHFLNFQNLNKEFSSFPLVKNDIIFDSDGNVYNSMLVLEKFADKYKDLFYIGNIEEKNIDFVKKSPTINMRKLFPSYINFENTVKISNFFTDLLLKNK